jgi:hypothetical protein
MEPLSREKMDCIALRYPYDMEYYYRNPCLEVEKILRTIVLLRFNEHDYHHRKGCFKKSEECRFHYPRKLQQDDKLEIDWSTEPSKWFSINGNPLIKFCHPFTMESKRQVCDLYLNTNNPVISNIFGYNNNVTMGNRNCIYYVTLYNTKGNLEEEQFPFLKHCTALAKRLRKLCETESDINAQLNQHGENGNIGKMPNFSVGLGHTYQGLWLIYLLQLLVQQWHGIW